MIKYVDETLTPITNLYWVHKGVQYPPNIFQNFAEDELEAVGVFTVVYESEPVLEGKQISHYEYSWRDGKAHGTAVFVDVPKVVPQTISRAQGKAALLSFGYLDDVESYIETMPEGKDKRLALLAFNETNEWQRESPFLQQMASVVGLTQDELDDLFTFAATIIL